MTDDIVTRIREQANAGYIDEHEVMLREAADEIERLRQADDRISSQTLRNSMPNHITITVQDSVTNVRVRCEAWDDLIHLTYYHYFMDKETETEAPSFTPEGIRALINVLNYLSETII